MLNFLYSLSINRLELYLKLRVRGFVIVILPNTPLFQAKTNAEFRIRMIQHIKENYGDLLGKDINLLDLPNGLEIVQAKIQQKLFDMSNGKIDLISKSEDTSINLQEVA